MGEMGSRGFKETRDRGQKFRILSLTTDRTPLATTAATSLREMPTVYNKFSGILLTNAIKFTANGGKGGIVSVVMGNSNDSQLAITKYNYLLRSNSSCDDFRESLQSFSPMF